MHNAAPKREERLTRIAVALVLLDGVGDGLFGETILELEGRNGKAVDE